MGTVRGGGRGKHASALSGHGGVAIRSCGPQHTRKGLKEQGSAARCDSGLAHGGRAAVVHIWRLTGLSATRVMCRNLVPFGSHGLTGEQPEQLLVVAAAIFIVVDEPATAMKVTPA